MKLVSEVTLRIKRGYLPHLTNEIYKRGCEIGSLSQVGNEDAADHFLIEIVYARRDKFNGFLEKIKQFSENFEILAVKNVLEDSIAGGLLKTGGVLPVEDGDDFEMKILGAAELIMDKAVAAESPACTGIARNVAVVSGCRSAAEAGPSAYLRQYVRNERDAVIISRFAGLNAFPMIVSFSHIEDFVRALKAVEKTYGAIRISDVAEIDDLSSLEQIFDEMNVPLVLRAFDEIPLCVLAAIIALSEKNGLEVADNNIGFTGLDVGVVRLTRLLASLGCRRILGADASESLMMEFEKTGGLATTMENIFSNSDIVVLCKDYYTIDDLQKIRPGQLVISLIDHDEGVMGIFRERGIREYLRITESHHALVYPGLLRGVLQAGSGVIDDARIISLARLLIAQSPEGRVFPDLFGDIHDRITGKITGNERG